MLLQQASQTLSTSCLLVYQQVVDSFTAATCQDDVEEYLTGNKSMLLYCPTSAHNYRPCKTDSLEVYGCLCKVCMFLLLSNDLAATVIHSQSTHTWLQVAISKFDVMASIKNEQAIPKVCMQLKLDPFRTRE